jgi:hypothetical protein
MEKSRRRINRLWGRCSVVPKKSSNNLSLAGFGDIFTASTGGEQITMIPLSELHPPEFHPFQVNDDEAMKSLAESVKLYGVREPGLASHCCEYSDGFSF